jgi:hypothetical protein
MTGCGVAPSCSSTSSQGGLSSIPLTLLEFYGLQLHHLSPHSLILVAIFVHFCEMFICVRASVTLLRLFHTLRWVGKGTNPIGTYYFHLQAKGPAVYITAITPGKWDCWREDWVNMRANAHDRLVLPTEAPMGKRDSWVEVPRLPLPFMPVVEWIRLLDGRSLTSMMVLFDFLSRCIAASRCMFIQHCGTPERVTPHGLRAVMTQV